MGLHFLAKHCAIGSSVLLCIDSSLEFVPDYLVVLWLGSCWRAVSKLEIRATRFYTWRNDNENLEISDDYDFVHRHADMGRKPHGASEQCRKICESLSQHAGLLTERAYSAALIRLWKSAQQYLNMMGFSCQGLIEQLSSSAGDGYTESQATYGARQAGAC